MTAVIEVANVSKVFRLPKLPKQATVKDLVIRTMRVTKGVSSVDALNAVSFSVDRGAMLGVVGRNGSGKTTLMRVLAGILKPDEGEVRIAGKVAPLLALGTSFHPDLTGREGARIELLALGMHPRQLPRVIEAIVEFSELGQFIDAPIRTYSQGMLMRLAFSAAVSIDPDVLLIDEILSVGDEAFAWKCAACLHDYRLRGKTIVLVTHNSAMVEEHCDVALWMHEGGVAKFGDPKSVVSEYRSSTAADQTAKPLERPFQTPESSLLHIVQ